MIVGRGPAWNHSLQLEAMKGNHTLETIGGQRGTIHCNWKQWKVTIHWKPRIGGICPTFQPLKVLSRAIGQNLAALHFYVDGFLFGIGSVTEVHHFD